MQDFEGVVTAIKLNQNAQLNRYFLLGDQAVQIKSEVLLNLHEIVKIKGVLKEGEIVTRDTLEITDNVTKKGYEELLKNKLNESIAGTAKKPKVDGKYPKPLNDVTSRMLPSLKKAVETFMRSYLTGAPMAIRFHNDCDGSSGAVALYNALSSLEADPMLKEVHTTWRMNKSVAYTKDSFFSDTFFFNSYSSIEKPLICIIDFGTSEESEGAIFEAESKCSTVWLDHHPIYDAFPKKKITHYINPWDFGGDSDYTAGFLACTFSDLISDVNNDELKSASLIGDFSVYADRGYEKADQLAVVLDFLTGRRGEADRLTPKYINSVIKDKEKFDETYRYASGMLNETLDLGVKKVKHHKTGSGIDVYLLDFEHISKSEGEYPLPGRYSSKLQSKMEELHGKRTVTMVHYGSFISIRVSRAITKELDLLSVIKNLRESCEYVYASGGHNSAASVKTDKEHLDYVLKLLLSNIGILI